MHRLGRSKTFARRKDGYNPVSITVINLANIPINSATNVATFNHSVHNRIGPCEYYIHDTIWGTYYTLRERWFCEYNAPYEQDVFGIVSTAGGVALAALGLVAAVVGAAASVILAVPTGGASIAIGVAIGTSVGYAGTAVGMASGGLVTAGWVIQGKSVAHANDALLTSIRGQDNRIFKIVGYVPFTEKVINGKTVVESPDPNQFALRVEEVNEAEFNKWRADGTIIQAADPLQGDVALLLGAQINEPQAGAPHIVMTRPYLLKTDSVKPAGKLSASADENDYGVHLVTGDAPQLTANAEWQLIPVRNASQTAVTGKRSSLGPRYVICNRQFTKFLGANTDRSVGTRSSRDMGWSRVHFYAPVTFELSLHPGDMWSPIFEALEIPDAPSGGPGCFYLRHLQLNELSSNEVLGNERWFLKAEGGGVSLKLPGLTNQNEPPAGASGFMWRFEGIRDPRVPKGSGPPQPTRFYPLPRPVMAREVHWTKPVTGNPNGTWATQIVSLSNADVRGARALVPYPQAKYGLVDLGMYYDGEHPTMRACNNQDGRAISFIYGNGLIGNVSVAEQDGYGIVDLKYTDAHGVDFGWFLNGANSKRYENLLPADSRLVGIRAKEQGGYGIVDVMFGYVGAAS